MRSNGKCSLKIDRRQFSSMFQKSKSNKCLTSSPRNSEKLNVKTSFKSPSPTCRMEWNKDKDSNTNTIKFSIQSYSTNSGTIADTNS